MLLVLNIPSANAIPAFARIHQTACQTCHVGFPKLNPFGEAFRLNGYRMPAEMQTEEKAQSIGAEAYKKMWPKAIWPSDIPAHVPLALNVKMVSAYASSLDENGRSVTKNDFQFPQEANLFSGGTLGDHFGFLGEVTWGENPDGSSETEIERFHLQAGSFIGPPHLVNIKIGKFAPDLADGFQEMWLSTNNGIDTLFSFNPIGLHGGTGLAEEGAGISLPSSVKGIELYGVGVHRFFYTVGIVNGLGPSAGGNVDGNSSKDIYARVDYKFGGMGLDGDTTGVKLPPENWRERSLRVGLLGYQGNGKGIDFPLTDENGAELNVQDRTFSRAGVYASWYFDDLNVFGVALRGRDRLNTFADGTLENAESFRYSTWFIQSDYVIVPPLQASLRYESASPPSAAEVKSLRSLNVGLSYFAYANVKVMLEYHRDLRESKNYSLDTILRLAF
jgi:hypothetical protein